jgi:hypothetical protein
MILVSAPIYPGCCSALENLSFLQIPSVNRLSTWAWGSEQSPFHYAKLTCPGLVCWFLQMLTEVRFHLVVIFCSMTFTGTKAIFFNLNTKSHNDYNNLVHHKIVDRKSICGQSFCSIVLVLSFLNTWFWSSVLNMAQVSSDRRWHRGES